MRIGNELGERTWWQLPISPDRNAEAGQKMFRATIVWFAAVMLLAVIVALVLLIT